MEETFIARFPELSEQIFEQLNNEDLIKSIEVSKAWCDLIDKRLVWKRMIQSCTKRVKKHRYEFNLVFKKIPSEILKKFALACLKSRRYEIEQCQCAPLHVAAANGDLLLFKHILEKSYDKNPQDRSGETPFHSAASYNQLEICKFIIEHAKDKNPKNYAGETPLHRATEEGNLDVFKLIFHHAEDKNPRDKDGVTPLHCAAVEGYLEMCKLIVSIVDDKNPPVWVENEWTPLHVAASNGYSEVYKLIAERVEEKNPLDNKGKTPLHEAIDNGHLHICRILLDILGIENPTLAEPEAKRLRKE